MKLEQAIVLSKEKSIVDVKTGELILLKTATDSQVSAFLSNLNEMRRASSKVEKMIKDHIKKERLTDEWDDTEAQYIGKHQAKRSYRKTFDKKRFAVEGTEEQKEIIEKSEAIKERYLIASEVITIR